MKGKNNNGDQRNILTELSSNTDIADAPKSNQGSSNIFITYFDNYAAYHFMAQYSIMPRLAAESQHIQKTFSTQFDNVILCSAKPILDNIITKRDDRFQVAFEINLEKLPYHKIFAIKDEDIIEIDLSEYLASHQYDLLAINNNIPFEAIEVIFVKSEEDKNNFINNRLSNIPFQHFNIEVNLDKFAGDDLNLTEIILSKISEIKTNHEDIKKVNHMRAALLTSLQCINLHENNSIATAYDKKMINILSNYIRQDDIEVIFSGLKDKAKNKLIGQGYKPLPVLNEDNTSISEFCWLDQQIKELALVGFKKPDYLNGLYENQKSLEALLDIYSFRVLCWLLINIEDYKPISFIDQFKKEFNHNIKNLLQSEAFNLSPIIEIYNSHFEKLKKNLKGTGSIASNAKQQDYSTLIALNHFGMSYEPSDHFSSLVKYLQSKQQINKYHKRLIWFFYGLCHGMYKVNNDFKKSVNDMAIIDNLMFYKNTSIPNLKPGNNEFIIENDGLYLIYTVQYMFGDLEVMINELLNKDQDKLENILLCLESVPKDYKCFLLDWNENDIIDYTLCKKTLSNLILKQEPTIKEKMNWEEFKVEGFIAQINTDDKKSLSLDLANLLYG